MQLVRLRGSWKRRVLGQIVSPTARRRCQKHRSAERGEYGSKHHTHRDNSNSHYRAEEKKWLKQRYATFVLMQKDLQQEVAGKAHHQSGIWSSRARFCFHCIISAALHFFSIADTRSAFISRRGRAVAAHALGAPLIKLPLGFIFSCTRNLFSSTADFYLIYWRMHTKENRFNCALIELTERRFSYRSSQRRRGFNREHSLVKKSLVTNDGKRQSRSQRLDVLLKLKSTVKYIYKIFHMVSQIKLGFLKALLNQLGIFLKSNVFEFLPLK